MRALVKAIFLSTLILAAAGCGDKDPPPVASNAPTAAAAAAGKVCNDAPKACLGGAAPTIDAATCQQTCPGE